MKFDVTIFPDDLGEVMDLARRVEDYGFDGLWTAETAHNPFLPLPLAAQSTERIELGTAIALAFPRSPMVTAQMAWDLAAQSGGRFMLGLGTQIKPHIVKRFAAHWSGKPVSQLRDYVGAVRAIWQAFQGDGRLRYRSEHYTLGLLTPFFKPDGIEHSDIPIYISGVGTPLCKLGGEIADGFHVHPFHTVAYLQNVVLPAMDEGAQKAERSRDDVARACAVFVVTGTNDEEIMKTTVEVKSQIAFYASTPSYRKVLEQHGYEDLGEKLNKMSKEGKWYEMWQEVPDELLHHCAVVAPPDELPYKVRERYEGLLTRVAYYFPFKPEDETRRVIWEHASKAMAG